MSNSATDPRLVNILGYGKFLLGVIDPEGILEPCSVTKLSFNFHKNAWQARLLFPKGKELVISGILKEKQFVITEIFNPDKSTEGKKKPFKTLPHKSVLTALGNLSKVPAQIKPFLSTEVKFGAKDEGQESKVKELVNNIKDAAFYGVEGNDEPKLLNTFKKWSVSYELTEKNSINGCEIKTVVTSQSSMISVSTDVNIYGLGNKKIILTKDLGLEHTAVIDCKVVLQQKTVPSLKVAFALDKSIPVLYTPERKKNMKIPEKDMKGPTGKSKTKR